MRQFSGRSEESACGVGIAKTDASKIASHIYDRVLQCFGQIDIAFTDRGHSDIGERHGGGIALACEKLQESLSTSVDECSDRSLWVSSYSESATLYLVGIILLCDDLCRAVPVAGLHVKESDHVGR